MHFLGNIEAKIDSKGRFFLPIQFRKLLQEEAEEKIILSKNLYQPCLTLFPFSTFNSELAELRSSLNAWNPKHQQILRQYLCNIEVITLDINGRTLIPKRYLKLAQITNEIRLIGVDNKIEVWAKELTSKPFMEPDEFTLALSQLMNKSNEQ